MTTNTQAVCVSFKSEILQAYHNFGTTNTRATTGADAFKAAIYLQGTGLSSSTTAYSPTGEAIGTGYTAGGIAVANATAPAISGTTVYWTPSANLQWTGLTISSPFDCLLIYNSSQNSRAAFVLTFPAQTISAGTFTYTVPSNTATTAMLQVN